ncbi:hypothetical protein [Meiothermus ruber]|jgi:hypothetical protein|uniref:Uncharacterized protein n=1 Tax=Meiothermus ruber (strain ATCC 35948 / DSM 1279 / VKM B-1258 / 21) TaxID=504728 RepID=D3PLR7_MEIRD|nr:hypothetical protein [Meiothermus ruber]ADD29158.1 conserved hypothetical protein [Meiothermus ruber DSM 1279]AGK05392.1 hypothetical protein K649_10500 [Meiothermus ruber DSM 1279]MCL6528509.1 hypothetical protein [Meiothermus ruber]MCX7802630.1 hypothetical protein [Meiothermus ruber]GAO76078.1 putative uncharacterized protein [Meiothermus ruber H328]
MTKEALQALLERHTPGLMALPNVVGVGWGQEQGREVVVVLVSRKLPLEALQPHERVPSYLEGVPVRVREAGALEAHK